MAGESLGTAGPIKLRNPGFLLDVKLQKGGHFVQPVAAEWTSFAYVCQGSGSLGSTHAQIEQVRLPMAQVACQTAMTAIYTAKPCCTVS